MKNRGVKDILIACIDELTGFPQAISAVFPDKEIQHCLIHQIRNSTKSVSYKDIKALMADLKSVYSASLENIVLMELNSFSENGTANIQPYQKADVKIGLHYQLILNILMKSERSYILQIL